jgi:hypothetical protein
VKTVDVLFRLGDARNVLISLKLRTKREVELFLCVSYTNSKVIGTAEASNLIFHHAFVTHPLAGKLHYYYAVFIALPVQTGSLLGNTGPQAY